MPIGATIGSAVAGIGSAVIGANAADRASKAEMASADKATATQLDMYNKTRDDLKPYNDTGKGATYTLAGLFGLPGADGQVHPPDYSAFENSPDYQFAKSEGIKSLDASAASKGNLLSGGMFKDLEDYAGGIASQNYGNYVQRLMGLAQLGENAGAQTGSFAVNTGANVANTQLRRGDAQASGIVGGANAITGGIGNVLKAFNQGAGINNGTAYAGSTPIYYAGPPGSVG